MSKKTTVLMILDGYGLNEKTEHNAVALGKTPVMDRLMKEYPFCKGKCQRYGSWASRGADGQFGSRALKYGCWKNCISRTYSHYEGN